MPLFVLVSLLALAAAPARGQKVIATPSDGNAPHGIAIDAATNKIYLADFDGTLTVLDGATNTITAATNGGSASYWAVVVNPVTNQVFALNRNNGSVDVYSGAIGSSTAEYSGLSVSTGGNNAFAMAINPETNTVYVCNNGSGSVTAIQFGGSSPTTTQITLNGGSSTPSSVAVNPATNMVYVLDSNFALAYVIDGSTNTLATLPMGHPNPIAVGSSPQSLAINSVTNTIYVANQSSNSISVINGATGLVTATVSDPNASEPSAIAVNPETNQVYVANMGSSNTTIINGANNAITDIGTNAGTSSIGVSIAVDVATNTAFIANSGNGSVTLVNGSTLVSGTVNTQAFTRAIAVNPVTHKVYAAPFDGTDISATATTFSVIESPIGTATTPTYPQSQPWAIAVNPVTNTIFVANNGSNSVSVIDGSTNTLDAASPITVGTNPNALVVDSINNLVYVSNSNSSSVSVINGASLTAPPATVSLVNGNNNLGFTPNLLAFNPVLNQVYGASTGQGVGFSFGGGAGSQAVTANSFFAGTTPVAIGTNPAQGYNYAVFGDDNSIQVSDVHGGSGFPLGCSGPTAADVNTVTNTIYVACSGSPAVLDAIQGADSFTPGNPAVIPLPNGVTPTAVAVNPTTNTVYVTDGDIEALYAVSASNNNAVTSVDLSTYNCVQPVSVALNIAANRIYVLCTGNGGEPGPNVVDIDGATNTILNSFVIGNNNANNLNNEVAVNPATGTIYALAFVSGTPLSVISDSTPLNNSLSTTIGLAANADNSGSTTDVASPVFTFAASNCVNCAAITGVFFQVDSQQGDWAQAGTTNILNTFTGMASNLAPGFHIMYAYATDGNDATSANSGPFSMQASPVAGTIESYGFLVAPPIATINSTTSLNPMNFGTVPVGSASPSPNPILINNGGAASSLSYSFALGGANPDEFVIDPNQSSCSANGGTLASNNSCEIYISFQPTATGVATATLTWTDNSLGVSNSTQVVYLSGTGGGTNVPMPTISEEAANPSYVTSSVFSWSDTDLNVTSYLCSLASGATPPAASSNYSPCGTVSNVANLQENTWYAYAIEAVDNQGNVSQPFVDTWEVIPSSVILTIAGTGTGSVSSNPSGLNCSSNCSVNFSGALVTLTPVAGPNSTFAGWSGATAGIPGNNCAGPGTCSLNTAYGPQPATATFTSNVSNFSVTVNELGTGTGTVSDGANLSCSEASGIQSGNCSNTYPSNGPTVTLTATATAPSTFIGWGGGACTPANSSVTPSGGSCGLNLISNVNVTANFLPAPTTITVTFPVSAIPVTETATYNCPGNANPSPANPCTVAQGPDATSLSLTAQAVTTSFKVNFTSTEVPLTPTTPTGEPIDGICESNDDSPTGVANDFDCRFLNFFNYGTDPTTSGAIVPLCVPYANGNCVHYEVSSPSGGEPDPSNYLGPINWVLTSNNDPVFMTPPGPYWTGSSPQLYDDPDYAVFPASPFGTDCTTAMTVNSGPPVTYACQFEFDITTFYNPTQVVDIGIGGTTRQFNDVIIAWPPTNVPGNTTLPLLNGNSTTTPANGSATFGNPVGFNITLTNNGTTTASGITLNDPLPSGATWTLASSAVGCSVSGRVNSQTLSCPAFTLAAGVTATFSVSSSNAGAGVYANTATFTIGTQQTLAVATVTVQRLTASLSGLSSHTISYGTSSVVLTGTVGAGGVFPPAGDTVKITINGTTQSATIAGTSGGFSYAFPAATIPASATPYTVTYNFQGDANFSPATNTGTTLTVSKASSTTTITSNTPNPSTVGQSVAVGFKVTGTGTPTGSVTVTAKLSATTVTCSASLSSGAGSCGVTLSTAGAWTLTASYGGDGNFNTSSTASGTTQTVNSAGSTLKFTPSALNFGTVYVGETEILTMSITNTGSSMVTFSKFSIAAITGDDSTGYLGVAFCPTTLNAGKSCIIIMSFTADSSVTKTHAANLVITDNAVGSPQMVLMSATVINPVASLSPSSLSFGNQKTGTTSAAKSVTLTNSGTTPLTLSRLSISGNFAFGPATTCTKTTTLNATKSCVMSVTFTPTSKGSKSGSISITDNARNSPQSISLSGTGN